MIGSSSPSRGGNQSNESFRCGAPFWSGPCHQCQISPTDASSQCNVYPFLSYIISSRNISVGTQPSLWLPWQIWCRDREAEEDGIRVFEISDREARATGAATEHLDPGEVVGSDAIHGTPLGFSHRSSQKACRRCEHQDKLVSEGLDSNKPDKRCGMYGCSKSARVSAGKILGVRARLEEAKF